MNFLTTVNGIPSEVLNSSSGIMGDILANWQNILIAIGLIFVGWLTMFFIQWFFSKLAKRFSLHILSEKSGFTGFLQKAQIKSPANKVIANFLGAYVFTLFFLAASNILGLTAISEFLDTVIKYIPNVIVALFIVLIGFQIANTVGAIVETTLNIIEPGASKILGIVSKSIVILFSILAAFLQLNIAENLVEILFTGVVAMLALAGGLAFGLGSKDFVAEILRDMKNHPQNSSKK